MDETKEISRRDFLKKGLGGLAIATGATAVLGKVGTEVFKNENKATEASQSEETKEVYDPKHLTISGMERVFAGLNLSEGDKQGLEAYAQEAWEDNKLNLTLGGEDAVSGLKILLSRGAQAGVNGVFNQKDYLPSSEGAYEFLRFPVKLQGETEKKLAASPQGAVIRNGSNLTVVGQFASKTGEGIFAVVAFDEGFERSQLGFSEEARNIPRMYLSVISRKELEGLINSSGYWQSQGNTIAGASGESYQVNTINDVFAKEIEEEAGSVWVDSSRNPVVGYPSKEVLENVNGPLNYQIEEGNQSVSLSSNGLSLARATQNEAGQWQWIKTSE